MSIPGSFPAGCNLSCAAGDKRGWAVPCGARGFDKGAALREGAAVSPRVPLLCSHPSLPAGAAGPAGDTVHWRCLLALQGWPGSPWHCQGMQDTGVMSWCGCGTWSCLSFPLSCWAGTGVTARSCSMGLCRKCGDGGFAVPTFMLYQAGFWFLSGETTKTQPSWFLTALLRSHRGCVVLPLQEITKCGVWVCRFERTSLQKSALCKKMTKF